MDRPNPYDFTRPVREPAQFIGRREELQRVRTYMDQSAADRSRITNLAILGPRGIGKTSMLYIARHLAADRGFLPVWLPLDEELAASDRRFFAEVFAGLGAPAGDLDSNQAMAKVLRGVASGLAGQGRPGAALFVDECDLLASNRILLQKIRNLFSDLEGYLLVLAGTPERFPDVAQTFAPFTRFFESVRLDRFAAFEETWACLAQPLGRTGEEAIDRASAEDLHAVTAGMPYEVKLLAHYMYDACDGRLPLHLSTAVLDRARPRLEEFRGASFGFRTPPGDLPAEELELVRLVLDLPPMFPGLLRVLYAMPAILGDDPRAAEVRRAGFERALKSLAQRGFADPQTAGAALQRDPFTRVYLRRLLRERGVPVSGGADTLANLLEHVARALLAASGARRARFVYRDAAGRSAPAIDASRDGHGQVTAVPVAEAETGPAHVWGLRLPGLPGVVQVCPMDAENEDALFAGLARRLERAGVVMQAVK